MSWHTMDLAVYLHHATATAAAPNSSQRCSSTNRPQAEVRQHLHHNTRRSALAAIRQRVEFKLCVLVFNSLHNLAPNYLSAMCQPVAENPSRRYLRSAARGDLAVPVTCTTRYGPRSVVVTGPSTWNSLPAPLRNCQLSSSFRHELKPELFARAMKIH